MQFVANYDAAYWSKLAADITPTSLMGSLRRMVENQEQKVTLSLVDDLSEHQVLEAMLEESKPAVPRELLRLDYLLRTPWRYPPLPWGSRFGRRHEPGIFYGSLSHNALFAEAAYYRFVFLDGMATPFNDRVISQHTKFEATYRTGAGVDLTQPPFARRAKVLMHKSNYAACQALGAVLREHQIEAVVFQSARAVDRELNVALFAPRALRSRKHLNARRGLCETHPDRVMFRFDAEVHSYGRQQFLENGVLPTPAR